MVCVLQNAITLSIFFAILAIGLYIFAKYCKCPNTENCDYCDHFVDRKLELSDASFRESTIDGKMYKVQDAHKYPTQAANLLSRIDVYAKELITFLKEKFINQKQGTANQQAAVKLLINNYNPQRIVENSPENPDNDTSYTINKGAVLAICLREKDQTKMNDPTTYDFESMQDLVFVTYHELTHMAMKERNHPPKFWDLFKFVLIEAEQAGIFKSTNYAKYPITYCGLDIRYNPRYDNERKIYS
jgi:hypothetical protein